MELFQLRYFVAAAREGSFSRAAEQCHVAQPSLSQQMLNLEREVGASLFVRAGRGVQLTDAGRTLREYAERILAQEEAARRAVRAVVDLEGGELSVWTLPTPGQHLLPPLLARFRRDYPGVALRVREATPARLITEAITQGRADLGIVHLRGETASPAAELSARVLLTEELAVVVPQGHPLTRRKDLPQLADLRDENFIFAPEGDTPEHPLYAACLAAGFTPRIACVSGSAAGMQALASAGLGIALLPRLALAPPDGAVVVELAPPRPTRTLAVVWRGDGSLSHAAQAFLSRLTAGTSGPEV